jgi:hypothetical protein
LLKRISLAFHSGHPKHSVQPFDAARFEPAGRETASAVVELFCNASNAIKSEQTLSSHALKAMPIRMLTTAISRSTIPP